MNQTIYTKSYVDSNGEMQVFNFDCPFIPAPSGSGDINSYCWIVRQNWRRKWFVELHRIRGVLYCGGWGIELDDGTFYSKDSLNDEVFRYDDLNKAIESCLKNNQINKVKVRRRGL